MEKEGKMRMAEFSPLNKGGNFSKIKKWYLFLVVDKSFRQCGLVIKEKTN